METAEMPRMRRTLAVAAAPLLVAPGAAPARAALKYDSWKNGWRAESLHVNGASKGQSAIVNTYTDDGSCADHGSANLGCDEEWQQISTGYAHEFVYENVNSGKCLTDGEDLQDQTATQYTCGSTYPVQRRWTYTVATPIGDGVLTDTVVGG